MKNSSKKAIKNPSVSTEDNDDDEIVYYSAEFILEGGLKKRPGCGKPYVCPVPECDKAYKNPNGIKYHAQYGHSKRQEFICDCGKVYSTRHGLMAHKKCHEKPEDTFKRTIKAAKYKSVKIAVPFCPTSLLTSDSQSAQSNWQDLDKSYQQRKKCCSRNEFGMCKELADHIYAMNTHELSMDELGSDLWQNSSTAPDVSEENYECNKNDMSFSPLSSIEADFHLSTLLSDIDIDDYPDIKSENNLNKQSELEMDRIIIEETDELSSINGCSTSSSSSGSLEYMEGINSVDQVLLDPSSEKEMGSVNGKVKTEHCYDVVFHDSETGLDMQEKIDSSESDNSGNEDIILNYSPKRSFAEIKQRHEPFYDDAEAQPATEVANTAPMPIVTDYWSENRSKPIARTGKLCDYSSCYDRDAFCNSTTTLKSLQKNVDSKVATVCAFGGCYELFTTTREYEHHINEIHPEGQNKMKYFERLINEIMNPNADTDSMDLHEYYFADIANNIDIETKPNLNKEVEKIENTDDNTNPQLIQKNSNRTKTPENDNNIRIPNVIQYKFEEIRFKEEVTDTTPTTMEKLICRESRKRRRKSPILKHLYEEENSVGISIKEDNVQQFSEPKSTCASVEQSPTKENEVNATEESVENLPLSEENDGVDVIVYYSAEFILEGGLKKRPGCGKPYICPVPECDKAYKNPNGIKYHAQYGHSEKLELICTCGRIYQTRHGLMAHKKTHESPEERLQRSRRVKNGAVRKTRRL